MVMATKYYAVLLFLILGVSALAAGQSVRVAREEHAVAAPGARLALTDDFTILDLIHTGLQGRALSCLWTCLFICHSNASLIYFFCSAAAGFPSSPSAFFASFFVLRWMMCSVSTLFRRSAVSYIFA